MPEEHSCFGYSAVSTFEQCPYRYCLQYIEKLETIPTDDAANPLLIGQAMHKGIETDADTAIVEYFASYPIITDKHIDEEIKLRYWIPKIKACLPDNAIHETVIRDDNFIGTADLLLPVGDGSYDLMDFKYSNNWIRYEDSRQLHLYKYYLEKTTDKKIRKMSFLFIPKVQIRQKKTETLLEFRQRLQNELEGKELRITEMEYNPQMVIDHLELTQQIMQSNEYPMNQSKLCGWCNYKKYCHEGEEIEMLPSTTRVEVNPTDYKKIWIYGAPFSGKTTLADTAPTPLNLNTDGNVKYVTMPRLAIKDTMEGRIKKPAWEVFTEAIDDLEDGSDFETIVVDLLEDVYDYARIHVCGKRGWEHESDDSFKAYEICRNEFLRTMRRLLNLQCNIFLISHEDTSKDITKRGGDKVTAVKPNIADKVATKIAGMVDVVMRAEKDGDEYTLSTKTSDVIFGGGRLPGLKAVNIPNTWDAIEDMYAAVATQKPTEQSEEDAEPVPGDEDLPFDVDKDTGEVVEEKPKRRTRRTRQ